MSPSLGLRSHCPHCGRALSWYDNIPVVSYLLLRGQCRYCSAPISVRYPIVELLNGLFYLYLVSRFGWQLSTAKMAVFVSMMLVLIFTDIADYILPDEITLGGLATGLVLSPFLHVDARFTQLFWTLGNSDPAPWVMSLVESAFAAAFVGGFLYATACRLFSDEAHRRTGVGRRQDDGDGGCVLGFVRDHRRAINRLPRGGDYRISYRIGWTQEVDARTAFRSLSRERAALWWLCGERTSTAGGCPS